MEMRVVSRLSLRAKLSNQMGIGAELAYQRVEGVVSTKVGYCQGMTENPTYEQVCSGGSGHVEVVGVDFDESKVCYQQLLDVFWRRLGESAVTLNQVGNDVCCNAGR